MFWGSLILVCLAAVSLEARHVYIIGGNDAEVGAWPWQVSMEVSGGHSCGASLISEYYVVTAAHCVGLPKQFYSLVVGLHQISNWNIGQPARHYVYKIVAHEHYGIGTSAFPNDIAVMHTSTPVDLSNPYVSVIKMADSVDQYIGGKGFITGWGYVVINQVSPADVLQEAEIDIISNEECKTYYGNDYIADYHICIFEKNKAGACNGDSGGPLVVLEGNDYVLLGATSWGPLGCNPISPAGYSSIPYFREWIRTHTRV